MRKQKIPRVPYFLCFFIIWILFMVFISVSNFGLDRPSIFSEIDEIAADGTYVYTIDNRNNTLCRYTGDGELVWSTSFSSTGSGRIFCDGGSLCRYDYRGDKVYVYGLDGEIVSSYKAEYDALEAKGFFKKYEHERREVHISDDLSYAFRDRLVGNSVITVTRDGAVETFTVEPWYGHVLWIGGVLLMVCLFLCGAYDLICSILKGYGQGQTYDMRGEGSP